MPANEPLSSGEQGGSEGVIRDWYAREAPSPQSAADIFEGEWASLFPPPFDEVRVGGLALWADPRVLWCEPLVGGFDGKRVLELGPLEGGHTYLLETRGAAVTAVEANARAFLKCLIFKEIVGLKSTRFLCGDFMEYLRTTPDRFDFCLASGVLYHMTQPAELIARVAEVAEKAYFWTHYYDDRILRGSAAGTIPASVPVEADYRGFRHTLYRQPYPDPAADLRFAGGHAPHCELMDARGHSGLLPTLRVLTGGDRPRGARPSVRTHVRVRCFTRRLIGTRIQSLVRVVLPGRGIAQLRRRSTVRRDSGEEVGAGEEVRVVEGVAPEKASPAALEEGELPVDNRLDASARRLVVEEGGIRREHVAVAATCAT